MRKNSKSRISIVPVGIMLTLLFGLGFVLAQIHNNQDVRQQASAVAGMRDVPDPLYGVTVDDISNITNIVDSSRNLSHMPTTRIVFDEGVAASNYVTAVNQIQSVSYIMGELLDSEGLANSSVQQYHDRTASYLSTLGDKVDIWEIGNEVNGNWTGPYASVGSKIYDAYSQVKTAGKRSALTLWYDEGCGNGPSELDPIAFSQQYVPADMRNGLDYVFVSYYETQCSNIRPSESTLTAFFTELHTLYPNAKLGFGEIGFPNKVGTNTTAAISMINYYYGLHITVPNYVGGYFWWYYYEDMLPYTTKPLWQTLTNAFNLEAGALSLGTPTIQPTAPIATPTFNCLGACSTTTPTNPVTIAPTTIVTPTTSTTTINPTEIPNQTEPTTDPCVTSNNSVIVQHKKESSGGIGDFIGALLDFLKQIIALLLQLLGGSAPNIPSGPTPTTVPIGVEPTTEPC